MLFFFSSTSSFALTTLNKRCRLNFGYFTNLCPLTLFLVLGMTMPYSRPWMISGKLFCLMFACILLLFFFFAFCGKIYFRFVGMSSVCMQNILELSICQTNFNIKKTTQNCNKKRQQTLLLPNKAWTLHILNQHQTDIPVSVIINDPRSCSPLSSHVLPHRTPFFRQVMALRHRQVWRNRNRSTG